MLLSVALQLWTIIVYNNDYLIVRIFLFKINRFFFEFTKKCIVKKRVHVLCHVCWKLSENCFLIQVWVNICWKIKKTVLGKKILVRNKEFGNSSIFFLTPVVAHRYIQHKYKHLQKSSILTYSKVKYGSDKAISFSTCKNIFTQVDNSLRAPNH